MAEPNSQDYASAGADTEKDVTQIHDEKHGHYKDERTTEPKSNQPHRQIDAPFRNLKNPCG